MKKFIIFLLVLTSPFWGPFIFVFVLGILPGEKFHYEVTEVLSETSLLSENYQTQIPLTIVHNYPQPYKTKGSNRLLAANQNNHPPDSSCKVISKETNRRLDFVIMSLSCQKFLRQSQQDALKIDYLPTGSILKVLGIYQLLEYQGNKRNSKKYVTEFLKLEDAQGNVIETSMDFFENNIVSPTLDVDLSEQQLLVPEVIRKIDQNGSVEISICSSNRIEENEISRQTQSVKLFGLHDTLNIDYSVRDGRCQNSIILEFSSKETYIRTLYLSELIRLPKGNWQILW